MGGSQDRIGLAEFLTDLRAELSEAQSRAANDSLKLGVEEISLTLEVAYTFTKGGEASAGVRAKFWVLASAEVGVKGSRSSERARTQQLTLTLNRAWNRSSSTNKASRRRSSGASTLRESLLQERNSRPYRPRTDPDTRTCQNLGPMMDHPARARVAEVIVSRVGKEDTRGSGYLVSPGWVLTAHHVVQDAASIERVARGTAGTGFTSGVLPSMSGGC